MGNLSVQAVTAGAAGNNLAVSVADGGSSNFIVKTYQGETEKDSQTVSAISGLSDNDYVTFSGSGDLEVVAKKSLSGGADAVQSGSLTATALYKGTYGNRLSFSVSEATGSNFVVETYLDGRKVDSQTVSAISGLVDNQYVKFSGTGVLFASSGADLTGGSNGTVSSNAYDDFFAALEVNAFDIVIYDGDDATLKSNFALLVENLSNQQGTRCQAVLSNYPSADNECVISVYPQTVTLIDGTVLSPEQLTWWVGGASSGANVYESLTYAAHPDAASISPKLSSSQQEAAIEAGQFVLIEQFEKVQVLTDINTFTTFSVNKNKSFRKNRVIRTVFGLCNDIYRTFALYYVGAVHNDDEGRKALKAEILNLLNRYQGNRAVQNVVADDVDVQKGVDIDAVVIECYIQPVDSIEKIYINITIS